MKKRKKKLKCDLFIIIMSQVGREKLGPEMAAGGGSGSGEQYCAPLVRCSFLTIARQAPVVPANRNITSIPGLGSITNVAFSHSASKPGFVASKISRNFWTLCMQIKQEKYSNFLPYNNQFHSFTPLVLLFIFGYRENFLYPLISKSSRTVRGSLFIMSVTTCTKGNMSQALSFFRCHQFC